MFGKKNRKFKMIPSRQEPDAASRLEARQLQASGGVFSPEEEKHFEGGGKLEAIRRVRTANRKKGY